MTPWSIQPVTDAQQRAALAILHGALPAAEAQAKIQADLERIQLQLTDTRALLVALSDPTDHQSLNGACWIEIQPGQTGHVHPTRVLLDGAAQRACQGELFQAATRVAADAGVTWLQSLLLARDTAEEHFLAAAGFQHLSTLSYQVGLPKIYPATEPATRLTVVPFRVEDRQQLAQVVNATYQGSLDSPALEGERRIDEVLAGYEAIGNDGARHWQLLWQGDEPIGCLLLAIHRPEQPRVRPFGELVYWGLIPKARGQGLGREIVQLALWQMRALGMEKLLLAVDERNTPALRIYEELGFFEWLVRHAWGKQLTSECAGSDIA